jgi:hypothetical protein
MHKSHGLTGVDLWPAAATDVLQIIGQTDAVDPSQRYVNSPA